jgi:hypothetical protein
MSDGNEARANLQEKLAQARRLLQQITDVETTHRTSRRLLSILRTDCTA